MPGTVISGVMLQILHFDPLSSGGRTALVHNSPGSAGFRMVDVADLHGLPLSSRRDTGSDEDFRGVMNHPPIFRGEDRNIAFRMV